MNKETIIIVITLFVHVPLWVCMYLYCRGIGQSEFVYVILECVSRDDENSLISAPANHLYVLEIQNVYVSHVSIYCVW